MNNLEEKITKDMKTEGKIMKVFMILLVIGIIFSIGYMSA
jgi:hypothetical protein